MKSGSSTSNSINVAAVALAVAILVVVVAVQRSEAVGCGQVDAALLPCKDFLSGWAAHPPKQCCDGVKTVIRLSVTPADKKATCICVKDAASKFSDLKDSAAKSLPFECQVTLDIPISADVDCNRFGLDNLSYGIGGQMEQLLDMF